jgi:hypothetical protein
MMWTLVICNIPCMMCIAGAVYLIATQGGASTGWGFLLFIAYLTHCVPREPDCDCDKEDKS